MSTEQSLALRRKVAKKYREINREKINSYVREWAFAKGKTKAIRGSRPPNGTKETLVKAYMLAKDVPCIDCKIKYSPWIMDFDHIGNDKLSDVSLLVKCNVPMDVLIKEIAKCEVVCSNCHRERTHYRSKSKLAPRNG